MATRDDLGVLPVGTTVPVEALRKRHHTQHVHVPRSSFELRLRHLWVYRRTIPFFGLATIQTRFQGMWLGWLWLLLRPAMQMLSKGFVFGGMLHIGSGDRPYIIFLMVGQASWDFFDKIVYFGFRSLRTQRRLLEGVPIPWSAAVLSTVIYAAFDAMTFVAIGGLAALYYKITQGSFYIGLSPANLVRLAFGIGLLAAWGVAIALIVAPLIMKVRDLRYVIRYALGFWFFLTPVLYATSSLPAQYRGFANYNPITAPIEIIKDSLLGTGPPHAISLLISVVGVLAILPPALMLCAYIERKSHARI